MTALLDYRFDTGSLAGQSFGNLFLAALNGMYGTFDEAVRRMSEVLNITGRVLPVTTTDVRLVAEFENGAEIEGESRIFRAKKENGCRVRRVRLTPESPAPLPEALTALEEADLIVIGPGSLYTSIIPNFLVRDIARATASSRAKKLFIMNIMTQEGETEGYTSADHVRALLRHAPGVVDRVLVNSTPIPPAMAEAYLAEGAVPLTADSLEETGLSVAARPLLSEESPYARHDEALLARALAEELLAL